MLTVAVYAYWAGTIPLARRSHRYAFGSLRPRQLDAMVMILLLANPVEGLDYAVRRQAEHASLDPFAGVRPPSPPHTQPPDGDVTAKVTGESMGRGIRVSEGFTFLDARHVGECFMGSVRHETDE